MDSNQKALIGSNIVTIENQGEAVELKYVDKVMIRFYQWGDAGLPEGLRAVKRKSQGARDARHAMAVLALGEDEERIKRGRVRDGHRDTGDPVLNGETGVLLTYLPAMLMEDGYRLVDFHVATQNEDPKKVKKGKTARVRKIPTWTFLADGTKQELENAKELLDLLYTFTDDNYIVFLFDNVDSTVTVNSSARGQAPKHRSFLLIEERKFALAMCGVPTEDTSVDVESPDGELVAE